MILLTPLHIWREAPGPGRGSEPTILVLGIRPKSTRWKVVRK